MRLSTRFRFTFPRPHITWLAFVVLAFAAVAMAQDPSVAETRARLVFGTTVSADLPTPCAESFSERLAVRRTALLAFASSHPAGTQLEQRASPEDVTCTDEDARHRIRLTVPPGAEAPIVALIQGQILCYGDERPSCTAGRQATAQARSTLRARLEHGE